MKLIEWLYAQKYTYNITLLNFEFLYARRCVKKDEKKKKSFQN